MKNKAQFIAGVLIGGILFGGTAAYAAGVTAERSTNLIYIDGERVELEAYIIDGSNYVKLRDVGEAIGFNVYWDGTVQIESDKAYTGEVPEREENAIENDLAYTIVELINDLRRKNGLNELTVSDALMAAAQERAELCAELRSIEHDKELSQELLRKYGYGNGGAECNLGSTSHMTAPATELISMFEESPGHLATMLMENAEDVGVGVYMGTRVYVVMYLGNSDWY